MKKKEYVPCPYCGEEILCSSKSCPHCGSDEKTGWSESNYLNGIDLPDEGMYEEIREKEFGSKNSSQAGVRWRIVVGIVVLVAFVLLVLQGIF
ncbi:hypothetical protein CHISP_0332 [Chitinispirillum alkaliphilum]|nr:hypothetical protein CHISP_0332 [Chitinispirillum alkaliphilum]